MAQRVIFLDRDGTINVDHGYVHTVEKWEWTPGAQQALKQLQTDGYALAVVTNQSAIADGQYTEEQMHELHDFMHQELKKEGITFACVAYCPHGRDQKDCICRKPGIGMAQQIEKAIGEIDYANSWTIGDKLSDIGFGKNTGTKTALIRSGYWQEDNLEYQPDLIVESLAEAATMITKS
ncbi:MAG: D-glycero-alpha-D-manno-heptose-1,7-bisphosphate 7-phosphatase [Candidatus Binatia bacterium]